MRKEYDIIGDAAYGCLGALIIGGIFVGAVWLLVDNVINYNKDKKAKKIEQYNSLEVQKYNADTLELFFNNPKVKTEFDNALKKNVYDGKMHVFGQSGDTIRIKFDDKRFQRQFEKQWNKYCGYKLGNINSKKVCNAKS